METDHQPDVMDEQAVNGADAGEIARAFLQEVLETIGMEVRVACHPVEDDAYRLEMEGPEIGRLIGRQGSTLGALQYLVTLVTSKRAGYRVRLMLDAEGYRARREDTLRDTARQWAEQVKETGQECVLDPMSPFDRRIVHTALADDPDVWTYSEGEEPERCVVISPRSAAPEGATER